MIKIQQLTKRFGDFTAVDQLSLEVHPGEVLGFLGPNGAGKSTTMKMVTGFLTPTDGAVSVYGHDIVTQTRQAQALMGYLPEGAPAYADMTVLQFLRFIAEIRGFTGIEKQQRISAVMEQLSLQSVADRSIENLSKGFKRRVGLAQAIIHDPKVLILDEPTDGLDPNQKQQVRDLIKNLSRDKIVIVSTHILEEVTAVCTRAVIIAAGQLRFDDSPKALLQRSRYHNAINIHFNATWPGLDGLQQLPGVTAVEWYADEQRAVVIAEQGQFIYPQVDDALRQGQAPIDQISVETGRLDEVFQQITQGDWQNRQSSQPQSIQEAVS